MGLFNDYNQKPMSNVNPEDAFAVLKHMMRPTQKQPAPSLSPLLSEFPDDDLGVGRRVIRADITESDEIVVRVRMHDGSVGEIGIKGTTLSQIILDRNAKALGINARAPDEVFSVDVGDGDIGGDKNQKVSASVDVDELLAASKKVGVAGKLPQRFA